MLQPQNKQSWSIIVASFVLAILTFGPVLADDFTTSFTNFEGTSFGSFSLDSLDEAGGGDTLDLIFGYTLDERFGFDKANGRFRATDDFRIEGNNSVIGQIYLATDHSIADSNATLNLGLNSAAWETISWDDAGDTFSISDDVDFNLNQLIEARVQNISAAPTCDAGSKGRIYFNTTDSDSYICDGSTFEKINVPLVTDVDTLDSLDSLQFLRSDTSDNFSSGTLTFDAGTTLDIDANLVNLDEITNSTLTLDSDNTGAGANVDLIAEQGTDLNGTLRYNATSNKWEISNNGAAFNPLITTWADMPTQSKTISFSPEYAGAVFNPDGSSNTGSFTAKHDAANFLNYYQWTTTQGSLQDYDIVIRYQLPLDFVSWDGSAPLTFKYKTTDGTASNNKLDITLIDTSNATASLTGNTALKNASWTTYTSSDSLSGGTWTAGSWITIKVKTYALTGKSAYAGEIVLKYNGR